MHRPGSALSKLKQQHQTIQVQTVKKQQEKKVPTKEEFVKLRDFLGAITLLEHEKLYFSKFILNFKHKIGLTRIM